MLKISCAGCLDLSSGISWQFSLEMCVTFEKCKKVAQNPTFGGSRSFKVINVSKTKKPVTSSACHDNQHYLYNIICNRFYARQRNASRVLAIAWASIRPSHCDIVSKWCKLESRNLHCGLPQGVFHDKISCPWVGERGSLERGRQRGRPTPFKKTSFCPKF